MCIGCMVRETGGGGCTVVLRKWERYGARGGVSAGVSASERWARVTGPSQV
jgi:hypothetical protein